MPRPKFAIRIVDGAGHVMYLRHGDKPGEGDVVTFPNKRSAEMAIATMTPGFEEDWRATIILYGPMDIGEERLA